jgi:hypothetical protein
LKARNGCPPLALEYLGDACSDGDQDGRGDCDDGCDLDPFDDSFGDFVVSCDDRHGSPFSVESVET